MNCKLLLFFLTLNNLKATLTPLASMTGLSNLDNFNNFWDGALGGRGYWGKTPQSRANVFSPNFEGGDDRIVYKLNSLSPFA